MKNRLIGDFSVRKALNFKKVRVFREECDKNGRKAYLKKTQCRYVKDGIMVTVMPLSFCKKCKYVEWNEDELRKIPDWIYFFDITYLSQDSKLYILWKPITIYTKHNEAQQMKYKNAEKLGLLKFIVSGKP